MTDHSSTAAVEARLHQYLAAELRRAEVDFPELGSRSTTRFDNPVPVGLALVAMILFAGILLLRTFTSVPNGVGSPLLGADHLPLSIDGESVLRGDAITDRLRAGGEGRLFLAGGRLVLRIAPCSFPSPATGSDVNPCPEEWWLEEASGSGPSFPVITIAGGATFVHTSGALTVFRVAPAGEVTRCGVICKDTLLIEASVWRQPTKGRMPPDAVPAAGGAPNLALVPDFVGAYGQDGVTIAGYVPKALLFPPAGTVPGTPDNPPQDKPLPVYGDDLTTLVGHMVSGMGFVPLSAPSAP